MNSLRKLYSNSSCTPQSVFETSEDQNSLYVDTQNVFFSGKSSFSVHPSNGETRLLCNPMNANQAILVHLFASNSPGLTQTCHWYLPLPLQVGLVTHEDDAAGGHVVALPQEQEDVLRHLEALPLHH